MLFGILYTYLNVLFHRKLDTCILNLYPFKSFNLLPLLPFLICFTILSRFSNLQLRTPGWEHWASWLWSPPSSSVNKLRIFSFLPWTVDTRITLACKWNWNFSSGGHGVKNVYEDVEVQCFQFNLKTKMNIIQHPDIC